LLIIGAMSRLNWMGRKSIPEGSWLAQMMARKPRMLVAIALANKDGPDNLGHADKAAGLPGSGSSNRSLIKRLRKADADNGEARRFFLTLCGAVAAFVLSAIQDLPDRTSSA
jgi:hypothetical protein